MGMNPPIPETVRCPQCGNTRVWRDGKENLGSEVRQRYLCKVCARCFYDNALERRVYFMILQALQATRAHNSSVTYNSTPELMT